MRTESSSKHSRIPVLAGEFFLGGLGYGALEIAWRGFTHISMILLGGVCFLVLIGLARTGWGLLWLCLAGSAAITLLELATGCLVNLWMGLDIWDYSQEALHLWGQVCPRFSLLWGVLCAVVIPLLRWCLARMDRGKQLVLRLAGTRGTPSGQAPVENRRENRGYPHPAHPSTNRHAM